MEHLSAGLLYKQADGKRERDARDAVGEAKQECVSERDEAAGRMRVQCGEHVAEAVDLDEDECIIAVAGGCWRGTECGRTHNMSLSDSVQATDIAETISLSEKTSSTSPVSLASSTS